MALQQRASTTLHRWRWDAERFGVWPGKLRARFGGNDAPSVLCVSIPKAGTHLVERAICLAPPMYRPIVPTVAHTNIDRYGGFDRLMGRLRPGQVIVSHLRYRPEYLDALERTGVRPVFLSRDPRDVVISQVHYVMKRPKHRFYPLFRSRSTMHDRLRLAIVGDPEHEMPSIAERLDHFRGWLDSGAHITRFEDLIGGEGGGDTEVQHETVARLHAFLGLPRDDATIDHICKGLFSSDSRTFRKGSIGGWRSVFGDDLDELFRSVTGDRAEPYGYRIAER